MNIYPLALDAFLTAQIDVQGDTIKALLVDVDYVYSAAHEFLDDVPSGARVGSGVTVTVDSVEGGQVTVDDIVFPSVVGGETATGVVLYKHTGADATANLIAYIDRFADTVPMSIDTNDGDVTLRWLDPIFGI